MLYRKRNSRFKRILKAVHSLIRQRCHEVKADILKARGIKTAVVSNKSDISVKPLAEQYFPELFDIALGVSDKIEKKPAPDMVELILEELSLNKEDAVYIGDSEVDILTAKNSGIYCINVTWGFRGRERLKESGAKVIVDTADEVFALIAESYKN